MRNPFSFADVPEPLGPDVEDFAASVDVGTREDDDNATAWVAVATPSNDRLDGAWSSRWCPRGGAWQEGVATVELVGERAFVLYRDAGTYLIEAERRGDRLVGRYVNVAHPEDTSPWLGIIVDNYRIDGFWGRGRWDLRRCSPDERPEPIVAALLAEARRLAPADLRELLVFARYLRWKRTPRDS
jgi:hypothetical protein